MLKETEQLMCFAAVCDNGSLTAASQVLGRSKAHISRQIAALEKRLDTTLMYRTTRKITLTEAGQKLQKEALRLYRDSLLINHKATVLDDAVSGRFVITAPVSLATFVLIPEIPNLQKQFPDVTFEVLATNDNLKLIPQGVDLAIRTGHIVDETLIAHQLGSAQDIFYADRKTAARLGHTQDLNILQQHRLLLNPETSRDDVLHLNRNNTLVEFRPQHFTKISEPPMLLNLAERGFGIACAPSYCQHESHIRKVLSPVFTEWACAAWPILLAYPFQVPIPGKLKQIAQALRESLGAKLN